MTHEELIEKAVDHLKAAGQHDMAKLKQAGLRDVVVVYFGTEQSHTKVEVYLDRESGEFLMAVG
jgi:hypothetical protein